MPFTENFIKECSSQLYERITDKQYSFTDLQMLSKLKSPTLCLVIIQLIRDGKVMQHWGDGRIYYQKCQEHKR